MKVDPNGNLIWERTYGDTSSYIANRVIEYSDSCLVTGSVQTQSGSYNAFVFKVQK